MLTMVKCSWNDMEFEISGDVKEDFINSEEVCKRLVNLYNIYVVCVLSKVSMTNY